MGSERVVHPVAPSVRVGRWDLTAYQRRPEYQQKLCLRFNDQNDAGIVRLPEIYNVGESVYYQELVAGDVYKNYQTQLEAQKENRSTGDLCRYIKADMEVISEYWAERLYLNCLSTGDTEVDEVQRFDDDQGEDFAADLVWCCETITRCIIGEYGGQAAPGEDARVDLSTGVKVIEKEGYLLPRMYTVDVKDSQLEDLVEKHEDLRKEIRYDPASYVALHAGVAGNFEGILARAEDLRISDTVDLGSFARYLVATEKGFPILELFPSTKNPGPLSLIRVTGNPEFPAARGIRKEVVKNWNAAATRVNKIGEGQPGMRYHVTNAKESLNNLSNSELNAFGKDAVVKQLHEQLMKIPVSRLRSSMAKPGTASAAAHAASRAEVPPSSDAVTKPGAQAERARAVKSRSMRIGAERKSKRAAVQEPPAGEAATGRSEQRGPASAPALPAMLTVTRNTTSTPSLHTLGHWVDRGDLGTSQWNSGECEWKNAEVSFDWISHRPGSRLIKRVGLGGLAVALRIPVKITFQFGVNDGFVPDRRALKISFGEENVHVKNFRIAVGDDENAADSAFSCVVQLTGIYASKPVSGSHNCALSMNYSLQSQAKNSKPEPAAGVITVYGNGAIKVTGEKMREHIKNSGQIINATLN
jgi:hypothetical protein